MEKKFIKIGAGLFVVALVFIAGYFFIYKSKFSAPAVNFSQAWRLVPEKVSRSAAIKIFAPAGLTKEGLMSAASFDPEIEGEWVSQKTTGFNLIDVVYGQGLSRESEFAIFKPKNPLTENLHYAVKVDLGGGKIMAADFLAVEDPKIDAIFPTDAMEAPEDSKITIAFNRPMIALTTLEIMEKAVEGLPIEITPKTDGRWKWISTNTLQFIPDTALRRSSDYYVKVNNGLRSLDGLEVAPTESHFKTRSLRYLTSENVIRDAVVYNQPVSIYFNQPVDLDKTIAEIKIKNSEGKEIPFTANYKKNDKKDNQGQNISSTKEIGAIASFKSFFTGLVANISGSKLTVNTNGGDIDKSIIQIFNKNDKFGRTKFWDAESNYEITIARAIPEEGNIIIDAAQNFNFRTTGLIKSWSEVNGRSSYTGTDLFDPEGQLAISFYEDIDLSASTINSSVPVVGKVYGQKCRDSNFNLSDPGCEKVEDRSVILVSFDKQKISAGQTFSVNLEKIANFAGQKINGDSVKKDIFVYKNLNYRIGEFKLNSITLCSNNPLEAPERKDLRAHMQANLDFEIFSWGNSWLKQNNDKNGNDTCENGEFETYIYVGLMPQSEYKLFLDVTDAFGQAVKNDFNITTGAMESADTDIFRMQQATSVATPDSRKLTYGAKNLTYINVSVCKLAPLDFYAEQQSTNDYSRIASNYKSRGCIETQTRRIDLPVRYWINNYFDIDPAENFDQPLGYYVVTLSHPNFLDYKKQPEFTQSFITITNLAASQKSIDPATYSDETASNSETKLTLDQLEKLQNLYWVSDIKTLNPVSGASVKVYTDGKLANEASTNNDGVATMSPVAGVDLTVVERDGDSTILTNYDPRLNWASSAYNVRRAYIYSDRPIYRPGDKANIRGILRLGYDGNYQMLDKSEIKLEIRDPRWNTIATPTVKLNEYGAFVYEFNIDSSGALGTYRICAGDYGCGNFDVKEYSPAAFKVEAKTAKDEYASKENAKIDVLANYYFGVPVANAKAEYTISSQNYYFDKYSEGNYSFGFYDECNDYYCYGDRFISRGTLDLDSQGKGTINQAIDLQDLFGVSGFSNSKIIVFDITVTNSMGQSISTQKSFIVHAGDYYLGAKASPSFAAKNQSIDLSVRSVDVSGKPVEAGSVKASIYRVDWVYAKRLEAGGNYNYDWTKKRNLIKTIDLPRSGTDYSGKISLDKEGEYEVDITSQDKRGNGILTRENIYVYGSDVASIRPNSDTSLTLKTPKEELKSGEDGQIIIESPFAKAKALIAIERGKIFDYKIVDINGSLYNYSFKAIDDYAPNVYVSVLLQSSDPAVKFGSQEFKINSDANKINVEVAVDKKAYQPGDKVVLDLKARDREGHGVSGEFSVAVADLSVLALSGNPKKDPLIFFYDGFPLTVSTSSNIKNVLVKVDKEALSKGGSGGGGEGEEKVRGDFRDTALWRGSVITDSNGNARVEFNLPDNLTTWQAEAVGVTKDTKVGAGYTQFISRKDLMVVPLKPRFIIPGDEFYIGSQVFNQSSSQQKLEVTFSSDTLQFTGKDKTIKLNLKAGQTSTVYFSVKAPMDQTKGLHSFTINAKGKDISDAVKLTIPVRPNLTYEAVATANYVTANSASEVVYLPENVSKEQGGLTVKSSATLAVFLSNGLNYLIGYPYGCTEQISSRLKSIAIVKAGLNVPNLADKFKLKEVWVGTNKYTVDDLVSIGLGRIYNNQAGDGGFGMWDGVRSDFYATLEAVDMLGALKAANVVINEASLQKGRDYLTRQFAKPDVVGRMSPDDVIAVAAVIFDSGENNLAAKAAIEKIAADNNLLRDKLNNKALAKLAIMLAKNNFNQKLKDNVDALLDNRITIDSRGAFLPANEVNRNYRQFETTISDTALYLDSLALDNRETKFTDRVARWLLNSRDKDGAWGSTQNTLAAVKSFTDFLNWKKETLADFTLVTSLNGKEISNKNFNAQTILDQSTSEIGAKEFIIGANNTIEFAKKETNPLKQNAFYYDMGLKYYLSGIVGPRDEGFSVTRAFYRSDDNESKTPLSEAKAGDVLRAHLEITLPRDRRFVSIEDYIPAGMEIVDLSLATEQKSLKLNEPQVKNNRLRPDYKELRDDRAFIYKSNLEAGTYEFDYYVRALAKGKYLQLPGVVSELYNPENFGRTASNYFEVK